MDARFRKLRVKHLDEQFSRKSFLKDIQTPPQGWIWEIRNALGMTHKQLANRLGISAPAVADYEKNEIKGAINIKTLKIASESMNCKLVYAIVPNTSLSDIINIQSLKAAKKMLKKVSHSMKLEDQDVGKKENIRQLKELLNQINFEFKSNIWDEI